MSSQPVKHGSVSGSAPGREGRVRAALLVALLVAAITFAAFFPALSNDFVNWDDRDNFIDNEGYKGLAWDNLKWMFTAFHKGHYHPLTWITLAADFLVWGIDDPFGFHLTSVLLHAANAALFYLLAVSLLSTALRIPNGKASMRVHLCAAFCALVYAVHPMRVEAVAWVTERRDVLNGFFAILSVLCYVEARRPGGIARRRPRRLLLAVLFYAASLLAKSMTMTLPFVLVLLDVYPLRRLDDWSREGLRGYARTCLPEKVPFVALSVAATVLALIVQRGALVSLQQYGLLRRLAVVAYGVVFYVRKSVMPLTLLPLYELDFRLDPFALRYVASAVAALTLTAALVALRKRYPALLVTWAAYLVILAPVSGISQNGPQLVANRYSYLACMPFALLAGGTLLAISRKRHEKRILLLRLAAVAPVVIVVVLCALTWRQTQVWRNTFTLWQYTLRHDPDCSVAHLNLGRAYYDRARPGDIDAAVAEYRESLSRRPNYTKAHINLGAAEMARGNAVQAIAHFQDAVGSDPDSDAAHYNLGSILLTSGEPERAIPALAEALRINPGLTRARVNLAAAYVATGDLDRALSECATAVDQSPDDPELLYNLANIHLERGDLDRAIDLFGQAIRIQSDFPMAHYRLGVACLRAGAADRAVNALREAIRLAPTFAPAHVALAQAHYQRKEYALAHKHARRAQSLGATVDADLLQTLTPNTAD